MNKLICIIIASIFSFSATAAQVIGTVKERNSARRIIFSVDENYVYFTLKEGTYEYELNKLPYAVNRYTMKVSDGGYKFNLTRKLGRASKVAYEWCWIQPGDWPPAFYGTYLLGAGAVATMGLCATLPGGPALIGVVLAPFDGLITIFKQLFGTEEIVGRKFNRMTKGKYATASKRIFDKLVQRIQDIVDRSPAPKGDVNDNTTTSYSSSSY